MGCQFKNLGMITAFLKSHGNFSYALYEICLNLLFLVFSATLKEIDI